jgi:hypothetical protein
MAHYAFLDDNNIVTEVIVGIDETELIQGLDTETWYSNFRGQVCKRTSYNGNIRYNYAGIGFTYDAETDAFIGPRPECNHQELFLNDKFQWNCQRCELEAKKLLNEA